ncbi:hypothetical protein HY408_02225 [Candidatus Gottesmanbacteria bacterium]|nr:hypothetical protein [Candidatus Gottesmanbacteria bacterium]
MSQYLERLAWSVKVNGHELFLLPRPEQDNIILPPAGVKYRGIKRRIITPAMKFNPDGTIQMYRIVDALEVLIDSEWLTIMGAVQTIKSGSVALSVNTYPGCVVVSCGEPNMLKICHKLIFDAQLSQRRGKVSFRRIEIEDTGKENVIHVCNRLASKDQRFSQLFKERELKHLNWRQTLGNFYAMHERDPFLKPALVNIPLTFSPNGK